MSPSGLPPELAPYQDEPKQLPSGAVGKSALLRLRFERRGDRSILASVERRAPLLVQRALYCDEGMPGLPWAFIITSSGGVLQGDRYAYELEVYAGAYAHITTQAATKIHEMDANYAAQTQQIILRDGAYLEYLPDPVIPFAHSRFHSRTDIRLAPSATLLYAEILMGGRQFYGSGELFRFDVYSSTVRAERADGAELFVEKLLIEPGRDDVSLAGVMGPFHVFGNVVLLTPKAHADRIFDQVGPLQRCDESWIGGISRLPNDAGLIYKVLGRETDTVKGKVRDFWAIVRPEVTGWPVPARFPWR
jgi:urease accessory protein